MNDEFSSIFNTNEIKNSNNNNNKSDHKTKPKGNLLLWPVLHSKMNTFVIGIKLLSGIQNLYYLELLEFSI